MSTENLLIELYQEQVDFLQKQIQKLKNHTGQTGQAPATEKKKVNGDAKKEKRKRSPSAYQVFMQEKLKQSHGEHNSGDDAKSIMTRVSKLWNELDEVAKQPYVKRAAELKTAMEANAAAANGAPAPVVVKTDVAKPSSSSAEQKPKESKKRKQPEPAAAEPVAVKPAAPVAAPVAAPATPAPGVPPTPTTAGEETAKKKKKKDKDPSNTDKKKKKNKEEKGN